MLMHNALGTVHTGLVMVLCPSGFADQRRIHVPWNERGLPEPVHDSSQASSGGLSGMRLNQIR